jgi:hypothetical protein
VTPIIVQNIDSSRRVKSGERRLARWPPIQAAPRPSNEQIAHSGATAKGLIIAILCASI